MGKNIYRIGYGYDIHRFGKNRKLILGGVEIPHTKGLIGHSDADVLLHAICDALLGAAGFEDIGHQFPDTKKEFKNISSMILLKKVYDLLKSKKWKIINLDTMILLEEPKIYKYSERMKKNISDVLKTKNISIKATTAEGLGFAGKKLGCSATAVTLIYK